MWSKLILLPRFQQLPDLGLPRFQLGNVVLIAAPGAVDAAANLVDVRGDSADSGSQLFLLGVFVGMLQKKIYPLKLCGARSVELPLSEQ